MLHSFYASHFGFQNDIDLNVATTGCFVREQNLLLLDFIGSLFRGESAKTQQLPGPSMCLDLHQLSMNDVRFGLSRKEPVYFRVAALVDHHQILWEGTLAEKAPVIIKESVTVDGILRLEINKEYIVCNGERSDNMFEYSGSALSIMRIGGKLGNKYKFDNADEVGKFIRFMQDIFFVGQIQRESVLQIERETDAFNIGLNGAHTINLFHTLQPESKQAVNDILSETFPWFKEARFIRGRKWWYGFEILNTEGHSVPLGLLSTQFLRTFALVSEMMNPKTSILLLGDDFHSFGMESSDRFMTRQIENSTKQIFFSMPFSIGQAETMRQSASRMQP